jgi:hypothetical protein
MPERITASMQECIDRCQTCQETCISTVTHCLQKGGKHAAPEHIQLLLACAEICDTSARFMLLESDFHERTCQVCAEVCAACAQDCESMADDDVMQQCADVCRRCAESCRQMATAGGR